MAAGLEPELSVSSTYVPDAAITRSGGLCRDVSRDGRCAFMSSPRPVIRRSGQPLQAGVIGRARLVGEFHPRRLVSFEMAEVVAPRHPLADYRAPIPTTKLARHVQLVLTDRSELSRAASSACVAAHLRLADLGAKHAFLRAAWDGQHAARRGRARHRRGALVRIHGRGFSARRLADADVGGLAHRYAARPRRPLVSST